MCDLPLYWPEISVKGIWSETKISPRHTGNVRMLLSEQMEMKRMKTIEEYASAETQMLDANWVDEQGLHPESKTEKAAAWQVQLGLLSWRVIWQEIQHSDRQPSLKGTQTSPEAPALFRLTRKSCSVSRVILFLPVQALPIKANNQQIKLEGMLCWLWATI